MRIVAICAVVDDVRALWRIVKAFDGDWSSTELENGVKEKSNGFGESRQVGRLAGRNCPV